MPIHQRIPLQFHLRIEFVFRHDGKPFVLKVITDTCSDGMSDNMYTLVSSFRYGDIDYKGCGEAAK